MDKQTLALLCFSEKHCEATEQNVRKPGSLTLVDGAVKASVRGGKRRLFHGLCHTNQSPRHEMHHHSMWSFL